MPASVQLYFKCSIIQNGFNFLDQNHHKDNDASAKTVKSWLFIVETGETAQKNMLSVFMALIKNLVALLLYFTGISQL